MAQASNVIPLPVEKITFEGVTLNSVKVLTAYEKHKPHIGIALELLSKSPAGLKKKVAELEGNPKTGENVISNMISDFDKIADALSTLADVIQTASARLTAVNAKLI